LSQGSESYLNCSGCPKLWRGLEGKNKSSCFLVCGLYLDINISMTCASVIRPYLAPVLFTNDVIVWKISKFVSKCGILLQCDAIYPIATSEKNDQITFSHQVRCCPLPDLVGQAELLAMHTSLRKTNTSSKSQRIRWRITINNSAKTAISSCCLSASWVSNGRARARANSQDRPGRLLLVRIFQTKDRKII